eukprot:scaffold281481_cov32-Tisochrysis_lutea.AAC.5
MPYAANLEIDAIPQVKNVVNAVQKVCYRGSIREGLPTDELPIRWPALREVERVRDYRFITALRHGAP